MKRIILLLMAAMLFVILLTACTRKSDFDYGWDRTETSYKPEFTFPREVYYHGYTACVLVSGNFNRNDFYGSYFTSQELDRAVYLRNSALNLELGIDVKTENVYGTSFVSGAALDRLRKDYNSNSYKYDLAHIDGREAAKCAVGGYLADMNTFEYLDTSMPWWDQNANTELSVNGKLFFTSGDISVCDDMATSCVLFNKNVLAENSELTSPYLLLDENKWTVDSFIEQSRIAGSEGIHGVIVWNGAASSVFSSGGGKICESDKNGLTLTLGKSDTVSLVEKYAELFNSASCYNYQKNTTPDKYEITRAALFGEGNAYFCISTLNTAAEFTERGMNFGILPMPKASAEQDRYYNNINTMYSQLVCIPAKQENSERTGAITEMMAYMARDLLSPAYKRLVIGNEPSARDSQVFDTVINSKSYDLGALFVVADAEYLIADAMNYGGDVKSVISEAEITASEELEKINEDLFKQIYSPRSKN
ncbi:MAG: extracellular solute-binding protein [Clostridia bacterium]|nr:extracellular solute-binding protein [Clostridia bacterium]